MFGYNTAPQMFVRLDKLFYEPGQQINGLVTLSLPTVTQQPLYLKVRLSGDEYVRFSKEVTRTVRTLDSRDPNKTISEPMEFSQDKNFLSLEVPISEIPPYSPPGELNIPFSLILGSSLPSSFTKAWSTEISGRRHQNDAHIRYSLAIGLKDYAGNQVGPEVFRPINIQNSKQQQESDYQGQAVVKTDKTHHISACCKDLGKIRLVAYFEKDRLYKDEDIMIVVELDGSQCETEISNVYAEFKEQFKCEADIHTETSNIVCKSEIAKLNLPPNSKMTGSNSIRLRVDLQSGKNKIDSTVKGKLISCSHTVTVYVTLKDCCATTPTSTVPVQVYERPVSQQLYDPYLGPNGQPSFTQRL